MTEPRPESGHEASGRGERPGATLRAAREGRGLSQAQAAHEMRIDLNTLRALESDDYSRLGAPIFVKGHLRNYAKQLGIASEPLLAAYEAEVAPRPPALVGYRNEGAQVEGELEVRRWLPLVLGGVALLLAALFGAYLLQQPDPPPAPRLAVAPATVPVEPAPVPSSAPAPASAPPSAAPSAAPASVAVATVAPAQPAGPVAVRLQLRFSAESWVEVYDSANKNNPLLYQLFDAGQAREISASPPLRVFIGQAPAVAVSIDGKRLDLAAFTKRDATARFQIAANGQVR
jgi:cytoskeleton protein RodZ